MKTSTTAHRHSALKKILTTGASLLFWLALWQFAASLIGEELFLASPVKVLKTLFVLMQDSEFYATISFSFLRISLGFLSGAIIGTGLGVAAYKLRPLETLFRPLMGAVKAAPVASFVIIALLLVGSKNLAVLISFTMVLPVFYSNILAGLKSVDPERFEAAAVFGMLNRDRFRFIYLPYVTPFFSSACELGIGVAWKAGVSAEVIGITVGSIGARLYDTKLNLETAELLAYTLTVIIISLLLERLALWLIKLAERALTN